MIIQPENQLGELINWYNCCTNISYTRC